MKTFFLILSLITIFSGSVFAGELPFPTIWKKISREAPGIKAAQYEREASESAQFRARLHWLPRVYAKGQAFVTNAPGPSLFSLLSQREITANDFSPAHLNHPDAQFMTQGSLGIDLPIFEGFSKVAELQMKRALQEAKNWNARASQHRHFAEAAAAYARLLSLELEKRDLNQLKQTVTSVLATYRVGQRSNPVGYSGLLGLRNLKNRVDALLNQLESSILSDKEILRSLAIDLPNEWSPVSENPREFLRSNIKINSFDDEASSATVRSAESMAESTNAFKRMERARFFPRVGLFAEGDLNRGSRATATSYAGGFYFQWDLFSYAHWNRTSEAGAFAESAREQATQVRLQSIAEARASGEAIKRIESNLKLLDESAEMLDEQARVSKQLFQTGALNALQLAEVLNRRADLLEDRRQAHLSLIQSFTTFYLATAREELR